MLLAPYACVLGLGYAATRRRVETTEERLWLVPAFVALHMGWGSGFWYEVFREFLLGGVTKSRSLDRSPSERG